MKITADIDIRRLTRVEGHGNIVIRIRDGEVVEVRWQVTESPRFFEAMLQHLSWQTLPAICARICGICSIGHTLASIRAIENAFGYSPSPQTAALRLLTKHMETLQSHVLHIFFLAAPDYLGCGSSLSLGRARTDILSLALRLKKLANDGADMLAGRRLHPTTLNPGGSCALPHPDQLTGLHQRLLSAREDLAMATDIAAAFTLPDFSRPTEYVSLAAESSYPFIGGQLASSTGIRTSEDRYLEMTNEYQVTWSTASWSRLSGPSFCVGARARLNNNGHQLHPAAVQAGLRLGILPNCHNPYANTLAQLVECVQVVEDSILLAEELLATSAASDQPVLRPQAGRGVGAVEVPRGILYHAYTFDEDGRITHADCVIPTSQNHASIQHDLEHLVRQCVEQGRPSEEIELLAAMLVRSYDPCISCSVH